MKYDIQIGDLKITLNHEMWEGELNVDEITSINTSNLFGEAVTISALVNRIGLLKSECSKNLAEKKLEIKVFESRFKTLKRKEASLNSNKYKIELDGELIEIKLTEKSLETCFENDTDWINLKKEYIEIECTLEKIDALYWASQDKARKLNNIVQSVTPEEMEKGLVQGKINGILINK